MVSNTEPTDRRMPLKEIEHLAFGSRQRNITFFYDNKKLFIFSLLCYFACWTPLPMIVLVALQCCLEDDRFGCSVIVDVALNFSLFVMINKYFLMHVFCRFTTQRHVLFILKQLYGLQFI